MEALLMKAVLWALCCLEVGLCFGMIDVFVSIRKLLNKRKIAAMTMCVVLMGGLLTVNRQLLFFSNYMWIFTMTLVCIFSVLIIRKNIILIIEVIVFSLSLMAVLDFLLLYIAESVVVFSFWNEIYFRTMSWAGILILGTSRIVTILIIRLLNTLISRDMYTYVWVKLFFPICIILCVMVRFFQTLLVTIARNNVEYRSWTISLVIFCWLVLLLSLAIFFHKSIELKKEKEILQIRDVMQEKRYLDLQQRAEENSQIIHDIKNHILTLQGLCRLKDVTKISAYLEDMNGMLDDYRDKQWCNHETVNTILNQKIKEMQKNDIEYEVHCAPQIMVPFNSSEIVIVLGNLLDNAIEATKKLPEGKRKITIIIRQKKQLAQLEIENTIHEKPKLLNQKIVTTKEEKGKHGYGLKNVERVVKKYQGVLSFDVTQTLFKISVLI